VQIASAACKKLDAHVRDKVDALRPQKWIEESAELSKQYACAAPVRLGSPLFLTAIRNQRPKYRLAGGRRALRT
jgi:hypothetical protein